MSCILIADDDASQRTLLAAALSTHGFAVLEAGDGRDAVRKFYSNDPDLVLLDVEMPELDGFAACALIRASTHGRHVPIVMITGRDDTDSIDRCFEIGATDFIAKPINWALIGHRIKQILRSAAALQALQRSEAENRALLEALPDTIYLVRADGVIEQQIDGGPARHRVLEPRAVGHSVGKLLPRQVSTEVVAAVQEALTGNCTRSFEYSSATDDGARHFELRLVPRDPQRLLFIRRDISERKRNEQRIHKLAYYDTLTGLPNRARFLKNLETALHDASCTGGTVAVLYIDIDRFKRINDTLGHTVGDAALQAVAARLLACAESIRAADHEGRALELARIGGDEFTMFARVVDEAQAVGFAQSVRDSFREPVAVGEEKFLLTPSIGVAVHPRDGRDLVSILKHADSAMFEAKAEGRNRCKVFRRTMNSRGLEQLRLENDLRLALADGSLRVEYQPKYRAFDRQMTGAEALMRWDHPLQGPISPARVIPIAEESGLIAELDLEIARLVGRQIRAWQDGGLAPVPVAINLSAYDFEGGSLYRLVRSFEDAGIRPADVELEITESALLKDSQRTRRLLSGLRDLGFKIALDDFGTAYSSLSYLKQFPLDTIKIDRSFVQGVEGSRSDAALCGTIIAMAHGLGCQVVAEGVETEAQLRFLASRGCDHVQGFWLSEPMSGAKFSNALAAARPAARARPRARRLALVGVAADTREAV